MSRAGCGNEIPSSKSQAPNFSKGRPRALLERQRSSTATAFEIWTLELLPPSHCFVATSWDLELVIWNFDLRRDLLSGQGVSVPGGTHPSFNHAVASFGSGPTPACASLAWARQPSPPSHTGEGWRRGRDSNPRHRFQCTRFPGARLKPLSHLSISARKTEGRTLCRTQPLDAMFFQTSRLFRDLPPSSQTPPTSPGIHFINQSEKKD